MLKTLTSFIYDFTESAFLFIQTQFTECRARLAEGVGACEASLSYQIVLNALQILDFYAEFWLSEDPFTPLASLGVSSLLCQVGTLPLS